MGFEFLIMPLRLTNSSTSVQSFIIETQVMFLDSYFIAYLGDIFIFSDTLDEYWIHVQTVLEKLSGAELHIRSVKHKFHKNIVRFLELIIGRGGVKMDPDKVASAQY